MPSLAERECHCAERQMERDKQRDKREQVQSGTKKLCECTPEGTTSICFYLISYQTLTYLILSASLEDHLLLPPRKLILLPS